MRKSGETKLPGFQEVPGKDFQTQSALNVPKGTRQPVERYNTQPDMMRPMIGGGDQPTSPKMPIMPREVGNRDQWNEGMPKSPSRGYYTHAPYGPRKAD
jgi:hypothetical protein